MRCWATTLTILYSWKNNNYVISIEDVLKSFGQEYLQIFKDNTGIKASEESELDQKAGLTVSMQQNPTITFWYKQLKAKGPLSITIDAKPPLGTIHAIVLCGIKGDGSSDNTDFYYVDPGDGHEHVAPFSKFIKLYEGGLDYEIQFRNY